MRQWLHERAGHIVVPMKYMAPGADVKTAAQGHRSAHGVLIDKTIAFLRPGKNPIQKVEQALDAAEGDPQWSHHQVAVPKRHFNLSALGFKPTSLAIPLPGEDWGTKSYRRGVLHAHEAGPVYLIHKDADEPGLGHLLRDVPGALKKRFLGKLEPFVKEKSAMGTTMHVAFLDELEKIAYGAEPSPRGNFLLASHGRVTIPLRTQSPGAARGVPMAGQEKDGDFGDYGSYNSADFKRVDINKKAAARQYANREELQQRRRDWGLDGATMSALVGALSGIPIGGVSGALARGRHGVVPGMLAGGVLGAGAGAIHGYRKGAKSIDAVLESKDFKRREERNKKASALTPAGRLASSRNQGTAAGSFQRKGPSVAEVSKLHGFGKPLAGTTKVAGAAKT